VIYILNRQRAASNVDTTLTEFTGSGRVHSNKAVGATFSEGFLEFSVLTDKQSETVASVVCACNEPCSSFAPGYRSEDNCSTSSVALRSYSPAAMHLLVPERKRHVARMLPLVSYVRECADGTDGETDGRTPDSYITLSARRGQRGSPNKFANSKKTTANVTMSLWCFTKPC